MNNVRFSFNGGKISWFCQNEIISANCSCNTKHKILKCKIRCNYWSWLLIRTKLHFSLIWTVGDYEKSILCVKKDILVLNKIVGHV